LITEGVWHTAHRTQCPHTSAVLQRIKRLCVGSAIGYAYFSVLKPGTVVTPHFGVSNVKLRLHLPLIVPTTDPTQVLPLSFLFLSLCLSPSSDSMNVFCGFGCSVGCRWQVKYGRG
jgi:hypothetical protein